MNDVVKNLIKKHHDFAEKQGFYLVSEEYSPEFGGTVCLKYQNDGISLMVSKSRDGLCYDVGPSVPENVNWYSVDILWNFLNKHDDYKKMKQNTGLSYIQDNYEEISLAFADRQRELTLEKLHQLEISRSKKLFGS